MLEIIIAILLSIGIKSDGSDIKILSDNTSKDGYEKITFRDVSTGDNFVIGGTEQSGWGIINTGTVSVSGN
ncbi:MAG: hypothetical protein WCL14_02950 [Bacteroidota bacterium]